MLTGGIREGMDMSGRRAFEVLGFCALFGAVLYTWARLAPVAPLPSYVLNPAYFALAAALVAVAGFGVLRLLPVRRASFERLWLAMFLAAMPMIYLWAALVAGDRDAIVVELWGLLVFGGLALLGYFRKSFLLLGLGIAAHGVAWDAWHHHRAGFIEPWYPLACLLIDLAFGILVAIQHVGAPGAHRIDATKAARR